MILVAVYGLLNGLGDIFKKKAVKSDKIAQVLFGYAVVAFVLVAYELGGAITLEPKFIALIALKTAFVFSSWFIALECLKVVPISVFGVINLSRILFTTLWGIIFLGESVGINHIIGAIIIVGGLLLIDMKNEKKDDFPKEIRLKYTGLIILSGMLATLSGLLDKILMMNIESGQLQFWFLLFLVITSAGFMLITRKKEKLELKKLAKNYWVMLMALAVVIGERALFIANSSVDSKLSMMALIKQIGVVSTVLIGGLLFKEKSILYRFACAIIVIIGIGVVVLF